MEISQDLKSFECSSLCELDKKFYVEQSLLGTSVEQLSTSRASNITVPDGADGKPPIQISHHLLSTTSSPLLDSSLNVLNLPDADRYQLAVPPRGKSSTPQVMPFSTQRQTPGFDLSNPDLSISQISWDLSLIKSDSPRLDIDQIWSLNPQPTSP